MIKRFFVLIIVFLTAGMTAACGLGVEQGEESGMEEVTNGSQGDNGGEVEEEDKGQGIVAGEIAPSLTKTEDGRFVYTVKNQTEKEVTFEFTSSQRYDYAVKNAGETIYLFSSTAAFMQVLGEETLAQGEELSYTFELPPEAKGKGDTLEVWLTPKGGEKAKVSMKLN
ncbi:BsuPI-related putative proteinase inhibitor [Bacillus sp. AK031]